ncbi:MAG: alanine--glyoxylate aminotransferase family protein [Chloroflexota bacterium]
MSELRIPGPTPCPPEVLQALGKQMIDHRGEEFGRILNGITPKLKQVFQTKNDVLVLTGSGTGGMEAAIVNVLSPGDKVLGVTVGVFGDRFLNIAQRFGAEVIPLRAEFGKPADIEAIRQALKSQPEIKAVIVTHNESSTGVTNDIAAISKAAKEFDKLIIVDAVSSLSGIDLPVDKWNLDVVVTASQKAWMVPPGLAMVSMSQHAWEASTKAKMPRFYWDLALAKSNAEKGQTPWTPAVSVCYALDAALDMILKEGIQNVFARHARVAQAARKGIKSLGLSLFADEKYASNTVTAVNSDGLDNKKMRKILREEYQIVLAGGQQKLDGKIFRIGHLGWVDVPNIEKIISTMKLVLPKVGFAVK